MAPWSRVAFEWSPVSSIKMGSRGAHHHDPPRHLEVAIPLADRRNPLKPQLASAPCFSRPTAEASAGDGQGVGVAVQEHLSLVQRAILTERLQQQVVK